MAHKHYTRRSFLSTLSGGCAAVGVTSLLSGLTNMGLLNAAAAANRSHILQPQNQYRALVCIFLAGGNDSFNMLLPRGNAEYAEYAARRTNLAIPQNQILPLNPANSVDRQLGLHPNLPDIKGLFDAGDVALVANLGTLVEPLTKAQYNRFGEKPQGLFSHSDQQQHWQTSVPQDRSEATGWAGRLADILYTSNNNQNISMNIAVDTGNTFQKGDHIFPYVIKSGGNGGSVVLNGSNRNNFYETLKRQTLDNMMDASYQNILEQAYTHSVKSAVGTSFEFNNGLDSGQPISTVFPGNRFGERLEMAAKTIAARNQFDVQRQTFFIQLGGFDTHGSKTDHDDLMTTLNAGLKAFHSAMNELGVQNEVTTFTMSDFGRKLISNGSGSDHAWGSHALLMGGAVNGNRIYGQYPDLYEDAPLEFGGGRLIPTTSCDEYYADLALWFGASTADIDQVFPNIRNFWTPTAGNRPIGFML